MVLRGGGLCPRRSRLGRGCFGVCAVGGGCEAARGCKLPATTATDRIRRNFCPLITPLPLVDSKAMASARCRQSGGVARWTSYSGYTAPDGFPGRRPPCALHPQSGMKGSWEAGLCGAGVAGRQSGSGTDVGQDGGRRRLHDALVEHDVERNLPDPSFLVVRRERACAMEGICGQQVGIIDTEPEGHRSLMQVCRQQVLTLCVLRNEDENPAVPSGSVEQGRRLWNKSNVRVALLGVVDCQLESHSLPWTRGKGCGGLLVDSVRRSSSRGRVARGVDPGNARPPLRVRAPLIGISTRCHSSRIRIA